MKEISPDLWQTKEYKPYPFLTTHAYLLKAASTNVLIYCTGHQEELDLIQKMGGISHQFLSHRHEVGPIIKEIKDRFNSKLCCDTAEKPYTEKECLVDIEIKERTQFENGILAIPTPGHTSGGCCYLYKSRYGRYLFTGDFFFPSGKQFSTYIVTSDGGSKAISVKSLEIIHDLEPDYVFGSAFSGEPYLEVTKEFWHTEIERNIRELKCVK